MQLNNKKDGWDKFQIIISFISSLAIPFLTVLLWIKGNDIQEFYKNKDANSKRYELFTSLLFPKLISTDSVERKAASIVIEQLAKNDTIINYEKIELEILALRDFKLAETTVKKISNDKTNTLSNILSKLKVIERDLINHEQYPQACKAYLKLYESIPSSQKNKINKQNFEKAKEKYESGGWQEAALIMKENFETLKDK